MFIILFSYISANKIRRIYYIIRNYLIIKWLKISLLPIFASYQQFQQMSYFFENCVGGGALEGFGGGNSDGWWGAGLLGSLEALGSLGVRLRF